MTEALKQWVADRERKEDPDEWAFAHPISRKAADFWLRAFCDAVDARAKVLAGEQPGHDPNFVDYSTAFEELRRELLSDN